MQDSKEKETEADLEQHQGNKELNQIITMEFIHSFPSTSEGLRQEPTMMMTMMMMMTTMIMMIMTTMIMTMIMTMTMIMIIIMMNMMNMMIMKDGGGPTDRPIDR